MERIAELEVNGVRRRVNAEPEASLLSVLRDQLDLTGTKYGCGEGECAACTVLIEGTPHKSCLTPVGVVAGKPITTIEGLERNGRLHAVQQAFLDEQALQCGYCTSGMILGAVALLRTHPHPSQQEIVRFMEGHICRCGVYPRIVAAIRRASELMKKANA
jgi:aerobic-type carbon monoxide dehydrogenase small subunit (CoxS/CutS family)